MTSRALAAIAAFSAAALASASPADAAVASALDENAAWLLAFAGLGEVPEGEATMVSAHGTTTMPAVDALLAAAARAGQVRLAALAASAAEGADPYAVGDAWVLETGPGRSCGRADSLGPGVTTGVLYHEQLNLYAGRIGHAESMGAAGSRGLVVDWTTKSSTGGHYADRPVLVAGQSDFWCVSFGFPFYIFFPYVTGVVCVEGHPACAAGGDATDPMRTKPLE